MDKALEKMEQADGKLDLEGMRCIDDILGNPRSKYKARTVEGYKASLREMNLTDMHRHARDLGLVPIQDRRTLESRLVKEYLKTGNKFFGTRVEDKQPVMTETLRKILSQGR